MRLNSVKNDEKFKNSEIKIDRLIKENQDMNQIMREIENEKIIAENNLREIQKSCVHYKEIAQRAENLENKGNEGRLKIVADDSLITKMENKRLEEENFDLRNKKIILEGEIERLNDIIYQMEHKIIELTNENRQIIERYSKLNVKQSPIIQNKSEINQKIFEKSNLPSNYHQNQNKFGLDSKTFIKNEPESKKTLRKNISLIDFYNTKDSCSSKNSFSSENSESPLKNHDHRRKLSQNHINNLKKQASAKLSCKATKSNFQFFSPIISPKNTTTFDLLKLNDKNKISQSAIKTRNVEELKNMIKEVKQKVIKFY